ncbi:MAG: protein translocase subunit SecD [Clostridiales bacterium]|nr:protein translocase subunit SecD [Clostridiales bacterium]
MKKSKGAAIIAVFLVCLILLGAYAGTVLVATGNGDENSITLGLDLSGGVSITYQIVDENPSQTDIEDTKAKLEQRAANYTTEYSVYQSGDDRITVEIPGVYDANEVLEELGSPGSLYFIVETDSDGNENYSYSSSTGEYELNYDIDTLIENGSVILTGSDVASAEAAYDTTSTVGSSEPVVELTFNDDAADIFAEATTNAYDNGESIGIYYDDHFISVPTVNSAITNGNCIINGMDSYEDAEELATFIRIGAINLELEELESSVVGAQLGSDALSSSFFAAVLGLIFIMIFMIVMYRICGVVASFALALYSSLVVLFIYWFDITLTLPGIAGIILGIGMAVDANVIIFARVQEEIAAGHPVNNSITEGFKKALSSIVDGNVTTFIASIVLMWLGSGTVRGFAYTFLISIIVSMFTALVISRYLVRAVYALGVRDKKFYGERKERKAFNILGKRFICFAISIVIIAAGLVGMIVNGATGNGALNFSLDFIGGTSTTVDMGQEYTIEELDADVIPLIADAIGDSEGNIQATTVNDSTNVVFKTKTLEQDEREAMQTVLEDNFGVDISTIETQTISSTISGEMRQSAIMAVIVACICMLLYIWFRFKDLRFATSAILALLHDVLFVLTSYALIRISVGNTFIACMLTILGYSINNTIVVFDRIRENMVGMSQKDQNPESIAEVANRSLTQTLARSINTSITTVVMVLLLYIMGVSSIKQFSLPLLVGLLAGTYSSIFIATALWYEMKLHLGKAKLVNKKK